MKYKIKNHIIDAKSPVEALKIHKLLDSVNDSEKYMIIDKDEGKYIKNFKWTSDGGVFNYLTTHNAYDADKFTLSEAKDILNRLKRIAIDSGYHANYTISEYLYDSKTKDISYIDMKKLIDDISKSEHIRISKWSEDKITMSPDQLYSYSINDLYRAIKQRGHDCKIINDYTIKITDSIKDEAFDRQTIEALIADETAAIDAYNVAIANLKNKISDLAIKVLQNIRDDEQNHVANLNAILSNNITEKNLSDSIKDDRLGISDLLLRAKEFAETEQYQSVANICFNIIQTLKRMAKVK